MNKQIELLRGVAILAVVGVHTTMFFVGTVTTLADVHQFIS
jgi:surface polysaccharide O-acyltransferase-like enzyme